MRGVEVDLEQIGSRIGAEIMVGCLVPMDLHPANLLGSWSQL